MRLAIVHRTAYAYSRRAHATIQTLRLTPREEPHQGVLHWMIHAPGSLVGARDAHGNLAHTLSHHVLHEQFVIEARGEVEVSPLHEGRLGESNARELPPLAYLAATPLTRAGAALRELAAAGVRERSAAGMLAWAQTVAAAIAYTPGATHVRTTADEALALGRGVCQDHAQVFVAGCRALGIPARYVSGYYYPGAAGHAESHAWADVWLEGEGWLSFDPTHRCYASDALCRLAVGRDYDDAAPVRGVRLGGGEESMEVRVNIRAI